MKCYWWKGKPNFGDRMAPDLLFRFSNIIAGWAPATLADIVCQGSIIEHLPGNYDGIVLGTGKMHAETDAAQILRRADVRALRGPLSAKGVPGDFALGDPGLLADELVQLPEKEFNLGIVPHWTDTELATRNEFLKYDPLIIDPMADPLTVIEDIGKCRKIVASSLHGVIVADAFGIPRRTEIAPRFKTHEGGMFKFKDYNASVGVDFVVGVTQEAPRHRVEDRQSELYDCFREIYSV